MAFNKLTEEERKVIEEQDTERPFSGEYDDFYKDGVYVCKKCNNPLYDSKTKFDAKCGWPAFDDYVKGSVEKFPVMFAPWHEIKCANCMAHLGHVFEGEQLTDKNIRHCVNSLSIKFIPKGEEMPSVLQED